MKVKKLLALVLAGTTTASLLTGCLGLGGQNKKEENTETAKTEDGGIDYNAEFELRFAGPFTDEIRVELLKEAEARLQEKWPNVTVVNECTGDYAQKVKLAFTSGDGYDMVYLDDLNQQALAENDYLMNITEDVEEYGWAEKSVEGAVEFNNLRTPGEYYSVPFLMAPIMVYYNKDIFEELKLEIPETVEELENVMKVVKEAGYIPQECSGDVYFEMLWAVQSMVLNNAPKEEVDDWYYRRNASDNVKQAFIEAFETVNDWYKKGYYRENFEGIPESDIIPLFAQGQSAMILNGDWNLAQMEMTGLNVGAFAFPGLESGTPYVVNAVDGAWALNAELDETKKAAALDWINIFFEEDYVSKWYEAGYTLSGKVDTSSVEATELHKEVAEAAENTKLGFYLDNVKPGFADVLLKETQLMTQGENTPEDLWEKLDANWKSE